MQGNVAQFHNHLDFDHHFYGDSTPMGMLAIPEIIYDSCWYPE